MPIVPTSMQPSSTKCTSSSVSTYRMEFCIMYILADTIGKVYRAKVNENSVLSFGKTNSCDFRTSAGIYTV